MVEPKQNPAPEIEPIISQSSSQIKSGTNKKVKQNS